VIICAGQVEDKSNFCYMIALFMPRSMTGVPRFVIRQNPGVKSDDDDLS